MREVKKLKFDCLNFQVTYILNLILIKIFIIIFIESENKFSLSIRKNNLIIIKIFVIINI